MASMTVEQKTASNSKRPPKTISIKPAITNGLASLWNTCNVQG